MSLCYHKCRVSVIPSVVSLCYPKYMSQPFPVSASRRWCCGLGTVNNLHNSGTPEFSVCSAGLETDHCVWTFIMVWASSTGSKAMKKKKASGLNKQILEKAVIDDMVLGDRGRDNRHETNKVNWNVVIHMSTTSDRLRLWWRRQGHVSSSNEYFRNDLVSGHASVTLSKHSKC